jgi:hypothetical protein
MVENPYLRLFPLPVINNATNTHPSNKGLVISADMAGRALLAVAQLIPLPGVVVGGGVLGDPTATTMQGLLRYPGIGVQGFQFLMLGSN